MINLSARGLYRCSQRPGFIWSPCQFHLSGTGGCWTVLAKAQQLRTARMKDYDLIVLIPWGIFGIAFIVLCVWLQVSSRRSQRDQAPPARRGAAASAEPADGHDAALPGQERVPGCHQDGRHQRAGAAPLDHGEHPSSTSLAVADARIPGGPHPASGPRDQREHQQGDGGGGAQRTGQAEPAARLRAADQARRGMTR
jgi:hypothetical protein